MPKNHPLRHAAEEFRLADEAYRAMIKISVGDFDAYDRAWRAFLHHIERVWVKTQAAVRSMPGWQQIESEVARLRKSDPLLHYVNQARNVDEHSVSAVASDWDANIRAVQIGGQVHLTCDPWDRPLLPVTNRGKTFNPPRSHLGQDLHGQLKKGKAEPVIVAEHALRFYVNFLNRVSVNVVGERRDP